MDDPRIPDDPTPLSFVYEPEPRIPDNGKFIRRLCNPKDKRVCYPTTYVGTVKLEDVVFGAVLAFFCSMLVVPLLILVVGGVIHAPLLSLGIVALIFLFLAVSWFVQDENHNVPFEIRRKE